MNKKLFGSKPRQAIGSVNSPSDEEIRRSWRLRWLSAIQAYSDTDTQNSRWCDPNERNPHFSLEECVIGYFDDVLYTFDGRADPYQIQREHGHVSAAEIEAVREFHVLADAYRPPNDDYFDGSAVVVDPAWKRVVIAAQAARATLLNLLNDENEILALTHPQQWFEENSSFRAPLTGTFIVPAEPTS